MLSPGLSGGARKLRDPGLNLGSLEKPTDIYTDGRVGEPWNGGMVGAWMSRWACGRVIR